MKFRYRNHRTNSIVSVFLSILLFVGTFFSVDGLLVMPVAAASIDHIQVTDEYQTPESENYTLMVYMVGSNLESRYGNATWDLYELLDAKVAPENANILVYTGGSKRWLTDIPNNRNCVLKVTSDGFSIVGETEERKDMGIPGTLTDFLNFCNTYYPAEHNGLIFWDHGGGSILGFGNDELFEQDSLLLPEMKTAMKTSPYGKKNKLDFVGFDACLMSTLETMNVWSTYADYFIGSEELEPGKGWEYSAFSVLNETTDTETIAKALVDGFAYYYEDVFGSNYCPDLTLSVTDLSKTEAVIKALGNLAKKMNKSASGSSYSKFQQYRSGSKAFGLTEGSGDDPDSCWDLMDLSDFAEHLTEEYPSIANTLKKKLQELVVYSYTNVEYANGVSIYYPYMNKALYQNRKKQIEEVSVSKDYTKLMRTLSKKWLSGRTREWEITTPQLQGNEYIYQLTEEQQENISEAYYTVLIREERYNYWPLLARIRITPDDDGVLHIPADPYVICMATETDELISLPVTQVQANEDTETYRTEKTGLFTNTDNFKISGSCVQDSEYNECIISLSATPGRKDDLTIQNVAARDEDGTSGKNTLETSHYESIYFLQSPVYPTYDDNGKLQPYREWMSAGEDITYYYQLKAQPEFQWERCSKVAAGDGAVIQLILQDTSGELYAAPLAEVASDCAPKKVEITTDKGSYEFRLMDKNAELISYTGSDKELAIPDTVEGLPVTKICESAFLKQLQLQNVTLPDTLKEIGDDAFSNCKNLQSIKLPSSLRKLGKNVFSLCTSLESLNIPGSLRELGEGVLKGCKSLEKITLGGKKNGSCKACVVKDGVLFSAEKTVLIAYPGAKEGSYKVPEGTKKIGYGAFENAAISSVELPKSLSDIGVCAFARCINLKAPTLPTNLETIEAHAFGCEAGDLSFTTEKQKQATLYIGKKVAYIGEGAFDLFTARKFVVQKDNSYYSAVKGNLCNGKGDAITAFQLDGTTHVVVPDGIRILNVDQLRFIYGVHYISDDWDRHVDIEIPASVDMIDGNWPGLMGEVLLHVESGSEAEHFAIENEIAYSYSFDPLEENYRDIVEVAASEMEMEKNGFIFDLDGKVLLRAPADIENAIIPSGTEEIGAKAFYGCNNLKKVVIPGSVKRIGDYAFRECDALEEIELPETIEEYGYDCFGGKNHSIQIKGGTLRLGEGLISFQSDSFNGLDFSAFEVSESNPFYGTVEGMLTDKMGTILYKCPTQISNYVIIPDGIIVLRNGALEYGYNRDGSIHIEDISVPDSVQYIYSRAIRWDYAEGYTVNFHVNKNSYGEVFAIQNNIERIYE